MISRFLAVPGLPQEVMDVTTTRKPPDLREQIAEALTELRGARDAYEHCPSSDNAQIVEYATWRLDRLIDRLPREETTCSSSD